MVNKIKSIAENCPNRDGKLYLLYSISPEYGFFMMNGNVMFVAKNIEKGRAEITETEKLVLSTKVEIKAVANEKSFEPGEYSYILYRGKLGESDLDTFIRICMIYVKDTNSISINEFFYSIIDMFQLPKEQSYKNLLGLYGELQTIIFAYNNCRLNLAKGWHKKSTEKFDFVIDELLLEVKTTTSDLLNVQLKHNQLFRNKDVFLAVVQVEESNAGKTLTELIADINSISAFSEDFAFQVALVKEIKRVSEKDLVNKKFNVINTLFYDNKDIPTIENIPDNITEISYKCSLVGISPINISNIKK